MQRRLIAAPPAAVFAAWGDAESLAVWMCPEPAMTRATVEVDFRVGGAFRIVMHGREADYEQTGEYLEIVPPRRLVFTWVSHFMPEGEQHTRVTVELAEAGEGKTEIVLTHEGLPAGDGYRGHDEGWAEILRRLAGLLEHGGEDGGEVGSEPPTRERREP